MVVRERSQIRAPVLPPPCPRLRASAAAHSRSVASSNRPANTRYLARRTASVSMDPYHDTKYINVQVIVDKCLSGRGVIQWKTESGEIREQEVGPGDTIHMPPGVVEHQLLNNGADKIWLAVVGVPPPRRRPL